MNDIVKQHSLLYKLYAIPGLALVAIFEFFIRLTSPDLKFFPTDDFPWTRELEAGWKDIREELDALLEGPEDIPEFKSLSEEQARITRGAAWGTFFMYAFGKRFDENCSKCPKTDALLQKIPGMKTALFSIFYPTTNLIPHRGPFKGVMRYHLAIKVPKDTEACGIRVGDKIKHWKEGTSIVFDDTYDHEAWNKSSEVRVVLFVDFLRDLPWPLSALNRGMVWLFSISPFIQNIAASISAQTGRVQDAKVNS